MTHPPAGGRQIPPRRGAQGIKGMTRKLCDRPLDELERRFQALRDQVGARPEASRPGLEVALQELSQAIAALRADREAGGSPRSDPPGSREAQVGQGGESYSPVDPAAYSGPCEGMLHHVFNAIPDLLTVHDRDFNTILSNWHGYESVPEAERRGQPKCYRVYHHRDRPCDDCHALEVLATGKPVKVVKFKPVQGRIREVSSYPVRDESGRVVLVVEHVRDITDRHRAEEALRDSEEKYRGLIETTSTGYVIIDPQGKVLDANPEYVRLSGHYRIEEMVGRNVVEWTSKGDRQRNAAEVKRCLQEGSVKNLELHYQGKDGRSIPVEINATAIMTSEGVKILSLARDITDRKQVETALKESEERFRAIFATAQDTIFIKDRSFRYTQVNPAMERLFGRSAAEIIGKTDLDLVGAADTGRIRKQDRRVLHGEVVKGVHTVQVRGVPVKVHYIKAPLQDDTGKIVGICGIARDITDLNRAEDALKESEERFRMLFDHAPDAYILADMQGEIIDCNQATEELAGYGRDELIGNNSGNKSGWRTSWPKPRGGKSWGRWTLP